VIAETSVRDAGAQLVAITMGIDAFERRRGAGGPLDGEGLVPIFVGDPAVARAFSSWDDARRALDAFAADVDTFAASPRRAYLESMIRALRAVVDVFSGADVPFRRKLTEIVGIPAEPVPDATFDAIHARVDELLRARDIGSGTLVERVRKWQEKCLLDPADIPATFDAFAAEAKARTDASIFPTGSYAMALKALHGVPYAGRCNFNEGVMEINLDIPLTRPALKHLVTHEIYPGHSTQLLYTKDAVDAGRTPADALLCTTNAIPGSIQEGIGDQGTALLDWIENEDDALQIEVRRAQTAAGTNAVYHLNESGWSAERCVDYFQSVGLGQEPWARVRTKMAQHAFRGPFLGSYWFGCEAVGALRERAGAAPSRAFYDHLYGTPHTLETLAHFDA
jgi:hypothetical protein